MRVCVFVDLEKIKNTTINIDYSLYLPHVNPYGLTPPSLTLCNDNPMSL